MERYEIKYIRDKYVGERGKLLYHFTTYDEEVREYDIKVRQIGNKTHLIEVITVNESLPEGCEVLVRKDGVDDLLIEVYESNEHWHVIFEIEGGDTGEEIGIRLGYYIYWICELYIP